ncbi:sugar ABC transporter substrate-binding protein, partial [Paenibacillus larvae]|nr:sugar ABC transporter substrate-binding protein [Paenibacillus larvae]
RKSQAKAFEGKGIGNPDNQNVAAELFKQAVHPADLFVDASVGEKIKQFKDQVQKPSYQAVLNGEKTPEQAFEDFKTKGKQIFRK